MFLIMLTMLCLTDGQFSETHKKRTEHEWICTRCRLPAEGSYCIRCGQTYTP